MSLFPIQSDNLLPFGGEVLLWEQFFTEEESAILYNRLLNETLWQQEPIQIFGKMVMQPRLTACYGEKSVAYSGISMQPHPWTDLLLDIRRRVEERAQVQFNSVLLNYYRDGNDSMGWHRDNERELGTQPVIASLSFGATRKFRLRQYKKEGSPVSIDLLSGSLLLMRGETQHVWEHQVPKTSKPVGGRVNMTFRVVM